MQKKWDLKLPNPKAQAELSDGLGIHPIVAQLLINRDILDLEQAAMFLNADAGQPHDPYLFKHMKEVVARIRQAQRNNEHVFVVGDYDVDGVTSSAILYNVLSSLGIKVTNYIPHRFDEGYGLNMDIARIAKRKKADLLITIDCGITACQEVALLRDKGIDVIIIDHHEPGEELPNANAILNPKQKDCPYPFKHLASVGLAVKLTQALTGEVPEEVLDLAAVGTIADVVPLHGENRVLVKSRLGKIHQTENKGLAAIFKMAKIDGKKLSPYYIGFIVGPRINAAGRMDSAHTSLDLFLSKDPEEAYALAQVLEKHNQRRQKIQRDIVQEAIDVLEQEMNFKDQKVIVLSKEGWHQGVLGIVASRIADQYYRPTIIISLKDGVGTASARSVAGFHLHEALQACSETLERFGGHQGAAGLTIKEEKIDSFREMINQVAHNTLEIKKLTPALAVDMEIPFADINMDLAHIINAMEPFGEGNPEPVFCSRQLTVKGKPLVLGRDTLKFWVTDGVVSISAIGFGMGSYKGMLSPGQSIDLAYNLGIDDWNKAPTVMLRLKDIKLSE